MKVQNSKFKGMQQVTEKEIKAKTLGYFLEAIQKEKLAAFDAVANLEELIDFCIEEYGAWKDAVLMGAGSYLKIGNYHDEIDAAKKYVKGEVYHYLTGAPFIKKEDYDAWHKKICCVLSDGSAYFQNYAEYRKSSKDKFKNKSGFTIGNAQKFLNMLMKDVYACLNRDSSFLKDYEKYFKYCHMPLDSYILRFVNDIRKREGIKRPTRAWAWSNLNSYDAYMGEQEDIRQYIEKHNSEVTTLQVEFVVWPLYK